MSELDNLEVDFDAGIARMADAMVAKITAETAGMSDAELALYYARTGAVHLLKMLRYKAPDFLIDRAVDVLHKRLAKIIEARDPPGYLPELDQEPSSEGVKVAPLDLAHGKVNALGGTHDGSDYHRGYEQALTDALAEIEKLGGRDPATLPRLR